GGVGPASGPSLVFQALPLAFDHLPYGRWFAWVFFALLVAVAMLMGIALFEPLIAWLCERFKWRRQRAALVTGIAAWLLGLVTVFSFNYGAFSFKLLGVEKHLGMFDILQTASAEFMLPLAACGMAIFAGWMMPTERARAELRFRSPYYFDMWLWLLRWVSPLLLAILLFTLYRL
ncbi:MAG: sodium-dependent transporter, partial [Sulfurifustis sp.]